MTTRRLGLIIVSLSLLAALPVWGQTGKPTLLNAAGATFPYPIYSKWFDEYHKLHPTYRSITNLSVRVAVFANCWTAPSILAPPTVP